MACDSRLRLVVLLLDAANPGDEAAARDVVSDLFNHQPEDRTGRQLQEIQGPRQRRPAMLLVCEPGQQRVVIIPEVAIRPVSPLLKGKRRNMRIGADGGAMFTASSVFMSYAP